jgi:CrcB protein
VRNIFLVGIGGGVGSIARYLVSGYVQERTGLPFPYGTLTVNVLGCLVIGVLSELADTHGYLSPQARALLLVGFLGGFTTYSTFGNETVNLFRDRDFPLAAANLVLHIVLGLGAVWLGRIAAYAIWR